MLAIGGVWLIFGSAAFALFGMNGSSLGVTISMWAGVVFPLAMLIIGYGILRPIADTLVTIDQDKISVKSLGVESIIPYSEIDRVKFSYIPYSGGWMKVVTKSGKAFSFTAALERSEYILDAIVNFNPKLVDIDECAAYRRTAIYYDHSWARMVAHLNNHRRFFVKYGLSALIFPVAFFSLRHSIYHDDLPSEYMMIWGILFEFVFALVLGTVIWVVAEVLVLAPHSRRQLMQNPDRVVRPVEFERIVAIWSDLAFILIQIGVLAILL